MGLERGGQHEHIRKDMHKGIPETIRQSPGIFVLGRMEVMAAVITVPRSVLRLLWKSNIRRIKMLGSKVLSQVRLPGW